MIKEETKKPVRKHKLSRDERDAILLLSYQYLHYDKVVEAKKLLMALHSARPRDISILPLLAYSQLRCQKPKNALKIMQELKKREWKDAEYYLLMAQILEELDERDEARRHYRHYIKLKAEKKRLMKNSEQKEIV